MSKIQFIIECEKRFIYLGIALENDALRQALFNRDTIEILRILDEEF